MRPYIELLRLGHLLEQLGRRQRLELHVVRPQVGRHVDGPIASHGQRRAEGLGALLRPDRHGDDLAGRRACPPPHHAVVAAVGDEQAAEMEELFAAFRGFRDGNTWW